MNFISCRAVNRSQGFIERVDFAKSNRFNPLVLSTQNLSLVPSYVKKQARYGVTTGVSAADRVTTIKAAIATGANPEDLCSPGHVFPLRAQPGGVFNRRGHTEGTIDLMQLAGLSPSGVLCELTNPDGTMARLPEIVDFALSHGMVVLTIEDITQFREEKALAA